MPKGKVRLNIVVLSPGFKRRESGSSGLKELLGQLRLQCQSSRPLGFVLLRPVPVWPGLAWTGLAQFMLAGQDKIRTCGSCMKAEERKKCPRWVRVQGWIHSAVWETTWRQNQNIPFRNRERRGTSRHQAAFHSPQPTGSVLFSSTPKRKHL